MRAWRLVTIDCWGVILANNAIWDARIKRTIEQYVMTQGNRIEPMSIDLAYEEEATHFRTVLSTHFVTLAVSERIAFLLRELRIPLGASEQGQLQELVERIILDPPPELIKGARRFLRKLKQVGLQTCLVSNTGWFSSRAIRTALVFRQVVDYLDGMVFSDVVGAAKPDPTIFAAALGKFGCRPQDAIHIGDQTETDVMGAKAAGLEVIRLAPREAGSTELCPTYQTLWQIWYYMRGRLDRDP